MLRFEWDEILSALTGEGYSRYHTRSGVVGVVKMV